MLEMMRRNAMTTFTHTMLVFAFAATWALPAAAQSANRTTSGAPPPAGAVVDVVQSKEVRACTHHCGSLAATAPHVVMQHQSVAERQARGKACGSKMLTHR
jgi:hypothetical protein